MIARIWYGYTTPDNADPYEALLKTERPASQEVEFATVMRFDSLESVKAFASADCETAVVLPKARALLKRFEPRSRHYEVREERSAR